jgi:predicted XRE-type DNA-binding protein
LSSTDEEARKKINKGIIHGLPLSAVSQVAHMIDEVASSRLSKQELIVVEKALFELTRQQKSSPNLPKEISIPNFWSSIRQLLTHLENELAETIRNEGMNAKTQLQSRRLGVARTSVSDLTRLRMNAFAQHAILSNLIKSPDGKQNENQVTPINWQRHDPSERIYYTGIERLVEKYKNDVSWDGMLHGGKPESIKKPSLGGNLALTEFNDSEEILDSNQNISPPLPSQEIWDEPELDEEDRIRQMDEFPERATGAMSATSIEEVSPIGNLSDMKRIRILQDLVDPIIDEDGTPIQLTAGEVANFSSLMADTLIAAGFAESAEI